MNLCVQNEVSLLPSVLNNIFPMSTDKKKKLTLLNIVFNSKSDNKKKLTLHLKNAFEKLISKTSKK
jgi:hypothetical protein